MDMDESKIILRTMQELNGPILEHQYSLLRDHLASEAGQLTVGAAFAAEREQYLAEQEIAERQQKFEAKVKEHKVQNVKFITSTVNLLPGGLFGYGPQLRFWNSSNSYLPALGTLDRTVFLPDIRYDSDHKEYSAYYVVGANVKKGLLLSKGGKSDNDSSYLKLVYGRQARKAARHFSQIPGNLNQQSLASLYDPETDNLKINEQNGHTISSYRNKIISQIDDATMYDFNVPTHLIHLTALFNVHGKWEKEVLSEYTMGIPDDQVSELKGILAAHSLPQITEK